MRPCRRPPRRRRRHPRARRWASPPGRRRPGAVSAAARCVPFCSLRAGCSPPTLLPVGGVAVAVVAAVVAVVGSMAAVVEAVAVGAGVGVAVVMAAGVARWLSPLWRWATSRRRVARRCRRWGGALSGERRSLSGRAWHRPVLACTRGQGAAAAPPWRPPVTAAAAATAGGRSLGVTAPCRVAAVRVATWRRPMPKWGWLLVPLTVAPSRRAMRRSILLWTGTGVAVAPPLGAPPLRAPCRTRRLGRACGGGR